MQRVPRAAKGSLLILGLFALVAIFADLLANPVPLVARVNGQWSLPALSGRPSPEPRAGDWALWAPVRGAASAVATPSARAHHLLGIDAEGRDVLAVTIRGTRRLVVTSLVLVAIALGLGAVLGWYAAFGSPFWDAILARLGEGVGVFPTPVLVALAVLASPSHRYFSLVAVVGALRGLEIARLLRADLLVRKRDPSLEAGRLLALSERRRARQWLALAAPAALLSAAFAVATLVAIDAGLTRIGLPVDGVGSWGTLLGEPEVRGRWLAGLGLAVFTGCLFTLADAARRHLRATRNPRFGEGVAVRAERST